MNDPAGGLTPEESELANSVFLAVRRRYAPDEHRTLEDCMRIWAAFVDRVEHGYAGIVAEYQNSLTYRDALEEVRLGVPHTIGVKLTALLQPLDARFLAATQETMRPFFLHKVREREFWWFRAPRKLALIKGAEEYAREGWVAYAPDAAFTFVAWQRRTTRPDEPRPQE